MPGPEPTLLAETEAYFVINKPIGWTVQRDAQAPSVLEWLNQQGETAFPVHRLDKPTSGLLLVARTSEANQRLSFAFAERQVSKTYLAISDRRPHKKQGWVRGDMKPARRSQWKLLREQNNPAVTQFRSVALDAGGRGFILFPKTGKTHQLRVALKSLGSPILGDVLYGGTEADRLYLHAWRLSFDFENQRLSYQVDPDSDRFRQWLTTQPPDKD